MNQERQGINWNDIVEFYREFVEEYDWNIEPFYELVKRLASSEYAAGLLVSTSHETLYLAQSISGLNEGPRLRIGYSQKNQEFTFTYESGYIKEKWWHRTASATEGFEVLERFLTKRARWFTKHSEVKA